MLHPSHVNCVPKRMRGSCLSCAGLLFGLLSASGCWKEVKAEFPRPPATAAIPPSEQSEPAPEPPLGLVVDSEPEPEPEPEIDEPEPEPPKPSPPPVAAEPVEETPLEPPSTQLASAVDGAGRPRGAIEAEAGWVAPELGRRARAVSAAARAGCCCARVRSPRTAGSRRRG